jgi:glycosylphosphatidylinositol transamidase
VAPSTVIYAAAQAWGISITDLLSEASFGWNVWGMYTPVVVWCLWWPAWLVGMINVFGEVSA